MATEGKGIQIIVEDKKYCTPCKKTQNLVTPLYYCTDCESYYCEPCFEFHSRIPLLAKHIVLKGKDIDVWENLPYKCQSHDKTYEFFCGKHQLLCCHVCVSLQHRSCTNMDYIPEKAKNICSKSELSNMKANAKDEMEQIQHIKIKFENKTQTNERSKQTFIKSLKEYRTMINGLFDSLEKRTLKFMDKKVLSNNSYIYEANKEILKQEQELCLLKQQLDSASPEKEVLVFICLKRGEKLLNDLKQELSRLDASTNRDNFQLVLHPEIETFAQNLPDLGHLEDEQSRQDTASDEKDERKFKMFGKCGRHQYSDHTGKCYNCAKDN